MSYSGSSKQNGQFPTSSHFNKHKFSSSIHCHPCSEGSQRYFPAIMSSVVKSGLLNCMFMLLLSCCKGSLVDSLDLSVPLAVVPSDCSLYDLDVFKILPLFMSFCFSSERLLLCADCCCAFQAAF